MYCLSYKYSGNEFNVHEPRTFVGNREIRKAIEKPSQLLSLSGRKFCSCCWAVPYRAEQLPSPKMRPSKNISGESKDLGWA